MQSSLKNLFVVTVTLCLSFFSLIGVITLAKLAHVSPSHLKDPNLVFNWPIMATILGILLAPPFIVFTSQAMRRALPELYLSIHRPLLTMAVGTTLGAAVKLLAFMPAVFWSQDITFSYTLSGVAFNDWFPYFAWYLALLVLNSWSEELVYRLFPIEALRGHYSPYLIVLGTATTFSLMHFVIEEPNLSYFLYRLAFGMMAGFLYLNWRSLWLITGLHTGWNFLSLSVSDAHWKVGGMINPIGLSPNAEVWGNVFALGIAALGLYARQVRLRKRLE